ncbi:MAG: helical backbone metal receptor [Thermoplasmatota archaeon]
MADVPGRIVSLVPSHTESLHDLGIKERVVGRTRFCIHPKPWVDYVTPVGGTKDAKLDKILALEPDLVVADKDENPKALIDSIQEAGVEVLWSEIDTVPDAADFLEVLGERCGVPTAGHVVAQQIRHGLEAVAGAEPVPVWCPIWYDPWMTFDRTAYPHAMLAAVGLENVFADHPGPKYFETSADEVAATRAAWTLLPSEPYPFHDRHDKVEAGGLPPSRLIDGEALTWFGTRTVSGLQVLAETADALRA